MNKTNKMIIGIVFGIAIIWSTISLLLTIKHLINTGIASMFILLPINGGVIIDLGDYTIAVDVYYKLISYVASIISVQMCDIKYISLALVLIGFLLDISGLFTKSSLDCYSNKNPTEYLWTHRPDAFKKCLLSPWSTITNFNKRYSVLPIMYVIFIPICIPWSIITTTFLVIPFLVTKCLLSIKIGFTSRKEKRIYSKNTRFAVCPKCKRMFFRPKIRCKCGLELEYPLPNIYGYKYHTCNMGHIIPCINGKRSFLRTICPYCSSDIETREAMPTVISMVGAVGSGKTTLVLAAIKTIFEIARTKGVTVDVITPGISKLAIMAKDVITKTAQGELDSECMFLRSKTMHDKEILINDISGYEFEPNNKKNLFEEYFRYASGIIFVFDPIALFRHKEGPTPMDIFQSFHWMFTQINRISPVDVSDIPLAIVSSKSDVMNPELNDTDVRKFLIENSQNEFIKISESLFSNIGYFSVKSIGNDCCSSMKPFQWVIERSDPELFEAIKMDIN